MAAASMVVAAGISVIAIVLGGLLGYALRRTIGKHSISICAAVFALLATALTLSESLEPSARDVFVWNFGIVPDESISELRSFVSQAEMQDPTEGLRFVADRQTVERLADLLSLGEPIALTQPHESFLKHATNPIPSWFRPHEVPSPLYWEHFAGMKSYVLYYDVQKRVAYLVVQTI